MQGSNPLLWRACLYGWFQMKGSNMCNVSVLTFGLEYGMHFYMQKPFPSRTIKTCFLNVSVLLAYGKINFVDFNTISINVSVLLAYGKINFNVSVLLAYGKINFNVSVLLASRKINFGFLQSFYFKKCLCFLSTWIHGFLQSFYFKKCLCFLLFLFSMRCNF
ncbi:hypothetical protein ACJX0J_019421 [Zea mays]